MYAKVRASFLYNLRCIFINILFQAVIHFISLFILDYPLVGVEQEAYWVTGWGIHMPWIGLDQQGCGYLKHNCTAETVTDVQKFSYPINIMKEYPRVSLKLKRRNHLQFKSIVKDIAKIVLELNF